MTFSGLLVLIVAARYSPSQEVDFILQLTGLGVAAGTVLGLVAERFRTELEWSRVSAFAGGVGFLFGLLLVAIDHLGGLLT